MSMGVLLANTAAGAPRGPFNEVELRRRRHEPEPGRFAQQNLQCAAGVGGEAEAKQILGDQPPRVDVAGGARLADALDRHGYRHGLGAEPAKQEPAGRWNTADADEPAAQLRQAMPAAADQHRPIATTHARA